MGYKLIISHSIEIGTFGFGFPCRVRDLHRSIASQILLWHTD